MEKQKRAQARVAKLRKDLSRPQEWSVENLYAKAYELETLRLKARPKPWRA